MLDEKALASRAQSAVLALSAVILTDIVAIFSEWFEVRLMNRVLAGQDVSRSSLDSADDRQLVVELVALVVYVTAIVFFLRWFHRAYANLVALGAELRFRPGWAIAGWFVPILWLWRPKQIANDIWRGSDPTLKTREVRITRTPVPALLNVWWAAWIAAGLMYARAALTDLAAPTAVEAGRSAALGLDEDAEEVRRAAVTFLVSNILDAVAAVLAIVVVRTLTARQLERGRVVATLDGGTTLSAA